MHLCKLVILLATASSFGIFLGQQSQPTTFSTPSASAKSTTTTSSSDNLNNFYLEDAKQDLDWATADASDKKIGAAVGKQSSAYDSPARSNADQTWASMAARLDACYAQRGKGKTSSCFPGSFPPCTTAQRPRGIYGHASGTTRLRQLAAHNRTQHPAAKARRAKQINSNLHTHSYT